MTDDLDRLVSGLGCVLFDFDGPICDVFAGYPAPDVADAVRAQLPIPIPVDIEATDDPMQVIAHAITVSQRVADRVETATAAAEDQAVRSAKATPGAAEAIDAARRSGRRIGFVSNNNAHAVAGYLSDHGLIRRGDIVSARAPGNVAWMKPDPYLVTQAITALGVPSDRTVLVGDSTTDIAAAHAAGTLVVGYANKPGKADRFQNAGADHVIDSMHTLAGAFDYVSTTAVSLRARRGDADHARPGISP